MAVAKKTYATSKKNTDMYRIIVQEQYNAMRVHGEKEKKGVFVKETNYYKSVEQLVRAKPHYANVLVNGNVIRYYLAKRPQKDN